jgi:Septum formation
MDLPPGYKTPEQRHMARRKQVRKGRVGLLIGAVILLLCIGATLALTARQNAPQTLADMEVGECYVGQNVGDVEIVECDQPHHGELFAVVGTEGLEEEYIGEDALRTDRGNVCIVELATSYYGAGPDVAAANGLEIKPFVPTEADWNDGTRDTYCVATAASGDTTQGSIEGEGASAAPATTAPPPPG